MAESKIPVDAPQKPVVELYAPTAGKGSRFIGNASREEVWAIAKRIYGDNIPWRSSLAIWGPEVVDARRVSDCPECSYAGDIFVLCDYHKYRQCPDCGGIPGAYASCTCP